MTENGLQIVTNGQYKNISLKDMEDGDSVVIKKTEYLGGMEKEGKFGKYYICRGEYKGEDVSFFLNNEDVHSLYESACSIGESVRITQSKKIESRTFKVKGVDTKKDVVVKRLSFAKV